nr:MAG TPA: antitoxin [Caudoviricetes sp.]
MDKKHMTTREKLELMKQIEERNEQRRKEYAAKKEREERLLDMYLEGEITKEELFKRIDE